MDYNGLWEITKSVLMAMLLDFGEITLKNGGPGVKKIHKRNIIVQSI